MKINPPGGDGFKVPEVPDNDGPDKVKGPGGADFEGKMDQTQASDSAAAAGKADGPQATKLREILAGIDANDPNRIELATERMVDWVLSDSFGDGVLKANGAESLRAAIREQLMADPHESARIERILNQL